MGDILIDQIEDEIFILRKKLNAVNSEIEERERDYEITHPNSYAIIDFRLFDLYKERKRLENKLSELIQEKNRTDRVKNIGAVIKYHNKSFLNAFFKIFYFVIFLSKLP